MDIPAWIAFFIGLYALSSGVGELRTPGTWEAMLGEFERSPALRYLIGVVCIVIGGAIYLGSPWQTGDPLSAVINVIGGLSAGEGMLILAAGDRFLPLARKVLGGKSAAWAGFSALFGMAAMLFALSRI
jgi:hypothetical protein